MVSFFSVLTMWKASFGYQNIRFQNAFWDCTLRDKHLEFSEYSKQRISKFLQWENAYNFLKFS